MDASQRFSHCKSIELNLTRTLTSFFDIEEYCFNIPLDDSDYVRFILQSLQELEEDDGHFENHQTFYGFALGSVVLERYRTRFVTLAIKISKNN